LTLALTFLPPHAATLSTNVSAFANPSPIFHHHLPYEVTNGIDEGLLASGMDSVHFLPVLPLLSAHGPFWRLAETVPRRVMLCLSASTRKDSQAHQHTQAGEE